MTAVVGEYFDTLARQGFQPTLRHVSGAVRCDLVHDGRTDHWLVHIDHGRLSVSMDEGRADCVIRTDEETFGRIVTGEVNALTALMRGMVLMEGDEELMLALQRTLPDPPATASEPGGGSDGR